MSAVGELIHAGSLHRLRPRFCDIAVSTQALPEAGATERSETLVRRSRKLVDVIVHHDFERLREEVHQVDRMDLGE